MKEPGRPVKLTFFDSAMTKKFSGLCATLGYNVTIDRSEPDVEKVETQQLTSTERRNLISKWSDVSTERIG